MFSGSEQRCIYDRGLLEMTAKIGGIFQNQKSHISFPLRTVITGEAAFMAGHLDK